MAIIDKPKSDAQSAPWFIWKYPSEVLRLGGQLRVGGDQAVLLVKAGQALDLFGPGTHTLSAANLPLVDKALNLTAENRSQFTAQVYYLNCQDRSGLRWETPSPFTLQDPVYNLQVSATAQGRWGCCVQDPKTLLAQMATALKDVPSDKLEGYLADRLLQCFAEILSNYFARGKTSVFEAHTKLNELSSFVSENLRPEFARLGFALSQFQVDKLVLPEDALKQFQQLVAQRQASQPVAAPTALPPGPSPLAPPPAGAEVTGARFGPAAAAPTAAPPAPLPADGHDPVVKLRKLKQLLDSGLITQQDFDTRKQKILDEL
jgi:membrane protease subunit (stomatin/prohibitin family)